MVLPDSHGVSRVPRYSGYPLSALLFAYRNLTFCVGAFQPSSTKLHTHLQGSYNPAPEVRNQIPDVRCPFRYQLSDAGHQMFVGFHSDLWLLISDPWSLTSGFCPLTSGTVWALPVSLAATQGIDYSFSSSGYLDVSLPRVVSHTLCVQACVARHYSGWVSPFGYLRI